jgi:hypothetical protein
MMLIFWLEIHHIGKSGLKVKSPRHNECSAQTLSLFQSMMLETNIELLARLRLLIIINDKPFAHIRPTVFHNRSMKLHYLLRFTNDCLSKLHVFWNHISSTKVSIRPYYHHSASHQLRLDQLGKVFQHCLQSHKYSSERIKQVQRSQQCPAKPESWAHFSLGTMDSRRREDDQPEQGKQNHFKTDQKVGHASSQVEEAHMGTWMVPGWLDGTKEKSLNDDYEDEDFDGH